jgi:signal transduction histidine kinase/CheY-like chemotaxis protein
VQDTQHGARQGVLQQLASRTAARGASLLEKYEHLVRKHHALVERYREVSMDRSSTVTLALEALRASRNGFALLATTPKRGVEFAIRNARWIELATRRRRWRALGTGEAGAAAREHESIEAPATALAQELAAAPAGTQRTLRLACEGAEDVVDLHLERVTPRGQVLVIATAEDVTEQVRIEREVSRARESLAQAERLRVLGELASGVAHDLNNTLHAIGLRLARLREATALPDEQRGNVEALLRIVDDTSSRVGRLQDLARRREDAPEERFVLVNVVSDAVQLAKPELEERAHLEQVQYGVEVDVPAGTRVVGSASELRHVFVNLLINARDAMPRGGTIRVRGREADTFAELTVEDEGRGIAPEHLDRVFEPFFTTKGRRGMGLGLALAQGVLQRLGGQITAGNRPEGGARFTLTFPLAPDEAPRALPEHAPRDLDRGHEVLVIDDDLDNLLATELVLEHLGQRATLASSGKEALEVFASGRRFELVLCDLGMPDLNGWQVAQEIQRLAPGTSILLLTGWAQEIAADDPRRALVSGVLGKPLDLERLQRVLAESLERPQGPPRVDGEAPHGAAKMDGEARAPEAPGP